jgi:hypothetical protein
MLLLALIGAARSHSAAPMPQLEADIRGLTLEQARKRPRELVRDDVLVDIARAHSAAMHRTDTLSHELQGLGPDDRLARRHRSLFGLVSENVAVQKHWPANTNLAKRLVTGWMESPGHRTNILAPYDTFEVGCYGDRSTLFCTQLFVRSSTRLAREVAFRQSAGIELTVQLAAPHDATAMQRISFAPAGAAAADPGAVVDDGAARLPVPEQPGLHQLMLWTQDADPSRYRIIGGPYVCVIARATSMQHTPDTLSDCRSRS